VLLDLAREQGFKGVVTGNAEAALTAIRRYRPHAITLDLKLPGMHGLALLDRLKNTPETRHIPVQIVSVADELPRRRRKGALSQIRKPADREAVAAQLERLRALAERPRRRLLVVEDDDTQRRLVEELVAGDDVEIAGVARGEDALAALAATPHDCVLVDLGLPDMDGFELIRRIREELRQTELPIVVHSGRDLTTEESALLYAHADAIVAKDAEAFDRLLDETALYLHRLETALPEEQRERLREFHRPESALAGKHVLIVDDDTRNIFALASLLEQHRLEVSYAESAREALAFLEQNGDRVDAVLMDVMMPEMDGNEATRRIRANPRFRTLPVIAVTAKAMKGDREKSLAAGASDYVTKPVNVDHLLSVLRVWIGR
jgi:CheY-like chemotaxis protein